MSEPTRLPDPVFATLVSERAKYSASLLTPAQIGAILNATAWIHRDEGVGLERKDGGTVAIQPVTGRTVWNGLRFMHEDRHYGVDICGGCSAGRFTPVQATPAPATREFVPPVQPNDSPTPDWIPEAINQLRIQLGELSARVQKLAGDQDRLSLAVSSLAATVLELTKQGTPARIGDPVFVSGSVSIGAALRGTRLTWVGRIGTPEY